MMNMVYITNERTTSMPRIIFWIRGWIPLYEHHILNVINWSNNSNEEM